MDCEVPEYLAGAGNEYWPRELDDDHHYFTSELLELLRHGRDAGAGSSEAAAHGSVVDEKPSPNLPSPSPLPTTAPKNTAGEAEMASWLCQVFDSEESASAADHHDQPAAARGAAETTEFGGSTTLSSSSGGQRRAGTSRDVDGFGLAASTCRGRRGGRRSCSGRAAEQRRRDKINDKMRTLQQLVPRCSKTDKASTLEEVIQYVKSLQHQLQVMFTGYASVPTACVQQGGRGVFPAGQPAVMTLPPYPFVGTAVFACPHPSNDGTSRQFVQHSHLVPSVDLAAAHGPFVAENRRRKRN